MSTSSTPQDFLSSWTRKHAKTLASAGGGAGGTEAAVSSPVLIPSVVDATTKGLSDSRTLLQTVGASTFTASASLSSSPPDDDYWRRDSEEAELDEAASARKIEEEELFTLEKHRDDDDLVESKTNGRGGGNGGSGGPLPREEAASSPFARVRGKTPTPLPEIMMIPKSPPRMTSSSRSLLSQSSESGPNASPPPPAGRAGSSAAPPPPEGLGHFRTSGTSLSSWTLPTTTPTWKQELDDFQSSPRLRCTLTTPIRTRVEEAALRAECATRGLHCFEARRYNSRLVLGLHAGGLISLVDDEVGRTDGESLSSDVLTRPKYFRVSRHRSGGLGPLLAPMRLEGFPSTVPGVPTREAAEGDRRREEVLTWFVEKWSSKESQDVFIARERAVKTLRSIVKEWVRLCAAATRQPRTLPPAISTGVSASSSPLGTRHSSATDLLQVATCSSGRDPAGVVSRFRLLDPSGGGSSETTEAETTTEEEEDEDRLARLLVVKGRRRHRGVRTSGVFGWGGDTDEEEEEEEEEQVSPRSEADSADQRDSTDQRDSARDSADQRDSDEEEETPETEEDESGAVFLSGSACFGVADVDSDLDAICVVPRYVSRETFFTTLLKVLESRRSVSDILPIASAQIPVIRLTLHDSVIVDLLMSRVAWSKAVSGKLDVSDDEVLEGMDWISCASLSGPRNADMIRGLVPNFDAFVRALRVVRLWAKRRAIYSSKMGYFGGLTWAILVAMICQLFPAGSTSTLLYWFFEIYSRWDWARHPVRLCDNGGETWRRPLHQRNGSFSGALPALPGASSPAVGPVSSSTLPVSPERSASLPLTSLGERRVSSCLSLASSSLPGAAGHADASQNLDTDFMAGPPVKSLHLMPVITPSLPATDTASSVTHGTRTALQMEFARGRSIMRAWTAASTTASTSPKDRVKDELHLYELFAPCSIRGEFQEYLRLDLSVTDGAAWEEYLALVESRLRKLTTLLENVPCVERVRIDPEFYRKSETSGSFYVGVEKSAAARAANAVSPATANEQDEAILRTVLFFGATHLSTPDRLFESSFTAELVDSRTGLDRLVAVPGKAEGPAAALTASIAPKSGEDAASSLPHYPGGNSVVIERLGALRLRPRPHEDASSEGGAAGSESSYGTLASRSKRAPNGRRPRTGRVRARHHQPQEAQQASSPDATT